MLTVFERKRLPRNGSTRRDYSPPGPFAQWGFCPTVAACLFFGCGLFAAQPRFAITNRAAWEAARPNIKSNLQVVMGPLPGQDKRCALNFRIVDETDCGAYVRRRITYTPEPNALVTSYLLLPKQASKAPAVLALHQTHALGPKVVVGLGHSPNDEYGVELASRGYVVLAPPYPLLGEYHPDLEKLGYQSGTMKAIWDNMRALDLLESLPYVMTNGFGAIGHSLGGHNALFTAAFDDRIKVVATSCGFDSFRDYMNGDIRGWTSHRYMPRLLNYKGQFPFDFFEVLALLAPRHCFVSAPLGDTNFKWRSVDAIAREVWPIYKLYHAEENLQIVHPDCGHDFPIQIREQAFRVFDRVLKTNAERN